jgi:uncharacterized protein
MRQPRMLSCRIAVAVAAFALVVLAGGCRRRRPVAPAYLDEVQRWQTARLRDLKAEDGWLTLIGLVWLKPGDNRFGFDSLNEIVLHVEGIPPVAGVLTLRPDRTVIARAQPEVEITLNGGLLIPRQLASDRSGKPDVLKVGRLSLYVIERSGQLGVRVKDPESPARRSLGSLDYFPVNEEYRVTGIFEPAATRREVEVQSAHGPSQKMAVAGKVRFVLAGQECALEPFVSGPDGNELFFVFADRTNGTETYGAGRFLDTPAPAPGTRQVVLDFNKAYSPPCAFTPFATCPLPTPENRLPLRVEAGEKAPQH